MCTSIGSKLKQVRVPSIPSWISRGTDQDATTTGPVPYAKAFDAASDDTKNEICAICQGKLRFCSLLKQPEASDDLESAQEIESSATEFSEAPCKHFFHGDCLASWLAKNKQCPTCRAEI